MGVGGLTAGDGIVPGAAPGVAGVVTPGVDLPRMVRTDARFSRKLSRLTRNSDVFKTRRKSAPRFCVFSKRAAARWNVAVFHDLLPVSVTV